MDTRTRKIRTRPVRHVERFRDDRPKDRSGYFLPSPTGDLETFFLPDVQIFSAGRYRGRHYSVADLDDMVANFGKLRRLVKPTGVIGHEEWQPLAEGVGIPLVDKVKRLVGAGSFRDKFATSLTNTGIPAVAWVVGLRRRGVHLYADFDRVPRLVRDLILAGAYGTVSAEVYHQPPEGCEGLAKGKVLRRVAFLGGELPHLKHLRDVAALYSDAGYADFYSAHANLRRLATATLRPQDEVRVPTAGGAEVYACFSEATAMPVERSALLELLKRLNCYTPAMDDPALYPDPTLFDQIGMHVENLATELVSTQPLSRPEKEQKALEMKPDLDPAQVSALSDEALDALLDELEDRTMPEKMSDLDVTALTDKIIGAMTAKFSELATAHDARMAEREKKAAETIQASVDQAQKALTDSQKAARDEEDARHQAAVFAELDGMVAAGILNRSEVVDDPKAPGNPGLKTTVARLPWREKVHTYKDAQGVEHGKSPQDLFMDTLRARKPSEIQHLPQDGVEQFSDEVKDDREYVEKYCKRQNEARGLAHARVN